MILNRRHHFALLLLAIGAIEPALALAPHQEEVVARLAEAGPGLRFGLVVAGEDGRELIAIRPEERFIPASNTKLLTTAAAFATFPGMDQPDTGGGASVRLDANGPGAPDVVLTGRGDARLSSAPECLANCLAVLADAVAARTRRVGDVIGDASLLPDQRWSPGMSWNNIPTRSGTAISALSLDDNELAVRVLPGAAGEPPRIEAFPYYEIDNQALTVTGGETALGYDRMPGSMHVRLTGTIAVGAEPGLLRLGIDDPAHFAAWRMKEQLEARGVKVMGKVLARHRALRPFDDPKLRAGAPPARAPEPEPLARLVPPPLADDVRQINKVSQNVHAELLLRRVGRVNGTGSIADGVAAVGAMMDAAGVPRAGWDIADGSGMSNYNRMAPRTIVTFLRWASAQDWGAAWRETLPIAGRDGTLSRRFRGTALEGRLFAKTGSLHATNALSGYLLAKSGRRLVFSAFTNDVPDGTGATAAMDAALVAIAEAN